MSVLIYSEVFKEWQDATSIGHIRIGSGVNDKNNNLMYSRDIVRIRNEDEVEKSGFSESTYKVVIKRGEFVLVNIETFRTLPLYEYRTVCEVIGNEIEGIKKKNKV